MIKYREEVEKIVNAMRQEYYDINENVLVLIDDVLIDLIKKHDKILKSTWCKNTWEMNKII